MDKPPKIKEQDNANFQESKLQFQEQIKSVIAGIVNIQQMTKKIFEDVDFTAITKGFLEFRENVVRYGDSSERFKIYIVEMGYPPHYEILPREVIDIVQLYEIDKVKATSIVNKFLLEKYNSDTVEQMFEKWKRSKWTDNRINVFSDIIKAHNSGLYNVSIPTTLAQIEGLIAQGFNHRGKMDGEIMKEYLTKLLSEEGDFSFDDAFKAYYFKHVLVNFIHGKPIKSFLSRNAILHGADVKYGTPENSLKSILLLDYIHEKITEFQKKAS